MKHKVCELEGALLDAAVAKAEGYPLDEDGDRLDLNGRDNGGCPMPYRPSTDWVEGGKIIEREQISLMFIGQRGWSANFEQHFNEGSQEDPHTGPTPLIAAMRAYVASKFGDEVDLPSSTAPAEAVAPVPETP